MSLFDNAKSMIFAGKTVMSLALDGKIIWEAIKSANYTNQVPISINSDGSIYNSVGYKDGYRIRSGGAEGAVSNGSCTGFIPVNGGDVVRLKGWTFTFSHSANAINLSDASFTNLGQLTSQGAHYGIMNSTYSAYGWSSIVEESDGVWKWIVPPAASGVAYIRISGYDETINGCPGVNMIVTVNEEIIASGKTFYSVTNTLTNSTSTNSETQIEEGASYNATISAIAGYKLDSVQVKMDGVDITSSVYSNGVINISSVTGDIIIIANATIDNSYTNLVPLSTDTNGSIFNGVGYKENVRLSSSGGISGSAQNGSVTTGFIPFSGDGDIIRMKGVEWKNSSANYSGHYYINFYDNNKTFLSYLSASEAPNYTHIVTVTRDDNGVETVVWNQSYGTTNALLQSVRSASYIRINAYGKGADMIVTINEEIT